MVRAVCKYCDQLVEITFTGKRKVEGFSACYWRVSDHVEPDKTSFQPVIVTKQCEGSGKLI